MSDFLLHINNDGCQLLWSDSSHFTEISSFFVHIYKFKAQTLLFLLLSILQVLLWNAQY